MTSTRSVSIGRASTPAGWSGPGQQAPGLRRTRRAAGRPLNPRYAALEPTRGSRADTSTTSDAISPMTWKCDKDPRGTRTRAGLAGTPPAKPDRLPSLWPEPGSALPPSRSATTPQQKVTVRVVPDPGQAARSPAPPPSPDDITMGRTGSSGQCHTTRRVCNSPTNGRDERRAEAFANHLVSAQPAQ